MRIRRATHLPRRSPLPCLGLVSTLSLACGITNKGGSQLRVQISGPNGAFDPNDRWCVPIGGTGGFIPWDSFNTACWGGYGNAYNGEPITQIAILVPGSNSVAVPFNFCINCIVESTGSPTGGTGGGGAISAGGAPAGSPVALHGALKVSGNRLVDQQNQPTQLKGPSSMWLNWENQRFAEDKQGLQWMPCFTDMGHSFATG